MRTMLIPFAIWLGVLQLPPVNQQPISLAAAATLISAALGLATLTVMVYRLGAWRNEMQNTKYNIGAEIARYREEATQQFEQIIGRFTAIDRHIEAAAEQRVKSERWQSRADTTIAVHDRQLGQVDARVARLEKGLIS